MFRPRSLSEARRWRAVLTRAAEDGRPKIDESGEAEMANMASQMVPKFAPRLQFFKRRLKQRATCLLNLVDRKGEKHQQH